MAEAVKENKMGTAPVGRLILSMSLPPVCSMFMQYSYNFVDSAFVAQLSEKALTAVSLSFPITSLMCACSIGLGVGINVVIARSLGRRDQDKANEIVTLGILMAFLFGVVLNLLAAAVSGPKLRRMTPPETFFGSFRAAMTWLGLPWWQAEPAEMQMPCCPRSLTMFWLGQPTRETESTWGAPPGAERTFRSGMAVSRSTA